MTPPVPSDAIPGLSMFWLRYGHEWEPCTVEECCTPVMPELRYNPNPTCFFHGFMCAPYKARKVRR